MEIEKINSKKQEIQTKIDKSKVRQDEIQTEINKAQEEFYSSGAKLSKSEQESIFQKNKKNELAIQKENLENELKTFTGQKDVNSKVLDELKLDLKEKEPLLERMDASISEIDGALSPIFLSKQILLELEDVKTNLAKIIFLNLAQIP